MTHLKAFFTLLKLLLYSLTLTLFVMLPAQAAVEYVAPVNSCTPVLRSGEGRSLSILAGRNVRFRVFGNSVDLSDRRRGFRMEPPNGTNGIFASIVDQAWGCGATGFSLVRIDSPTDLATATRRTLFFKMPLGDETRLPITIKPLPAIDATWTTGELPSRSSTPPRRVSVISSGLSSTQPYTDCIVKTGKLEKLNQNHTLRIQLPPGHQQDRTSCFQSLTARIVPSDVPGGLDINESLFRYTLEDLPNFLTSSQTSERTLATVTRLIQFPINVARIRTLTTPSNSTITVRSPNRNQTSTLALEIIPNFENGFAQPPVCRNRQTGNIINVEDPVDCELSLALPPTPEQLITYEVDDRLCVRGVGYSEQSGIGSTTLTGNGTVFSVLLRTRGVNRSQGGSCASETGVQHMVKFWIGEKNDNQPDATATFRIRSLQ